MNLIEELFQTLQGLVVSIPLNNPLSYAYVILNLLSGLFALFTYGGSDSSSGGLFGGLFGGSSGGLF